MQTIVEEKPPWTYEFMAHGEISEDCRKVADLMSAYWANFAANGDPNGRGLPRWPAFGEKAQVMEVGDKIEPIPIAGSAAQQAFFEAFLTRP